VPVKELEKSDILQSNEEKLVACFFWAALYIGLIDVAAANGKY